MKGIAVRVDNTLVQLAAEINAEHSAAVNDARSAIEHARRAGERLIKAKENVPHGQWLPWLEHHCPDITPRSAQRYMRLAARWPEIEGKCDTVSHLAIGDALRLLEEPKPITEPIVDDLAALKRIRTELDVLRRTLDDPNASIDEVKFVLDRADTLAGDAWEVRVHSLAALGKCRNRLAELLDPETADFALSQPAIFARLAQQRLDELTLAPAEPSDATRSTDSALFLGSRAWFVVVEPFTDPAFAHVTVTTLDPDDPSDKGEIGGTKKPIRRDAIAAALTSFGVPSNPRWHSVREYHVVPQAHNRFLSPEASAA